MTIEVDAKTIAKEVAVEVIRMMQLEIKRQIYPLQIKGDSSAGTMIGVTGEAMKQRRHHGFYRDGYHFEKKSDKIIMWNRDALLEEPLNDKSLR